MTEEAFARRADPRPPPARRAGAPHRSPGGARRLWSSTWRRRRRTTSRERSSSWTAAHGAGEDTVKAAVLTGPRAFRLETVRDPAVGAGEALVRVAAAGICGTDYRIWTGERPVRYPLILGHEFIGDVVAVGAGVTRVAPGDRVAVEPNWGCGACDLCRGGSGNLCLARTAVGHRPRRRLRRAGRPPGAGVLAGAGGTLLGRAPLHRAARGRGAGGGPGGAATGRDRGRRRGGDARPSRRPAPARARLPGPGRRAHGSAARPRARSGGRRHRRGSGRQRRGRGAAASPGGTASTSSSRRPGPPRPSSCRWGRSASSGPAAAWS